MSTRQLRHREHAKTWQDPATVRAELRAGLLDQLIVDFSWYHHGDTWLAVEPAERRAVLDAGPADLREEVATGLLRVPADRALPVLDEMVAQDRLRSRELASALGVLLKATGGPAAMPDRARRYLDAALPHAPRRPLILRQAARVQLALGDRDAAFDAVTTALRHGERREDVRDDMRLVELWSDPRFAALFADLDPPVFTDPAAAVAHPELVRRIEFPRSRQGYGTLSAVPVGGDRLTGVESAWIDWRGDRAVLDWLAGLPRLARLDLRGTFDELPAASLVALVTAPALGWFRFGADGSEVQLTPGRTAALRAELLDGGLEPAQQRLHAALLFQAEDQLPEPPTERELLGAVDSAVPVVRQRALRLLADRPVVDPPPLSAGDQVVLAGKVGADRTVLRERLTALGVTLGRVPGPKTRLAVLGERTRGLAVACHDAGVPLLPEDRFTALLDAAVPGAITATADTGSAAQLIELLDSTDEANIKLAVQLMRSGGLPDGLLERLILLTRNPAFSTPTRTAGRKLLTQHTSPQLQEAYTTHLARRQIYTLYNPRFEIRDFAADAGGGVDALQMYLLLMGQRREKHLKLEGRWWPLDTFPDVLCTQPDVVELTLEGTGISTIPAEVSGMIGLRGLHLENNRFAEFPAALLGLPQLQRLYLTTRGEGAVRLTTLPAETGRLTELWALWLDGAHLPTLPDSMATLPRLHTLRLRDGRLGRLPGWVADLPELDELDLGGTVVDDLDSVRAVRDRLRGRDVEMTVDALDA